MTYSITIKFSVGTTEAGDYCEYKMCDSITGSSNAFSAIETYKNRVLSKYESAYIYSVECYTMDAAE